MKLAKNNWLFVCYLCALFFLPGCSKKQEREVVVYTAQDQVYAEPIFQDFTRQTSIQVRPLFDSEAVKTVGLANRLLAEKNRPQADLFWGNEELRARQLELQNVFQETNRLAVFGFRTRRIVVNTNFLSLSQAPRSLIEITNVQWKGKVALAYPMFGTTATYFLALRSLWGTNAWETWCRALQDNKPFLVDGNSVVVKLVGRGEAWIGLTDSDDIFAGQREKMPIAALPVGSETLYIPNAVGIVRGAPHPKEAIELLKYLQSPQVIQRLVQSNALEGAFMPVGLGIRVDWQKLISDLEPASATLKSIFLK